MRTLSVILFIAFTSAFSIFAYSSDNRFSDTDAESAGAITHQSFDEAAEEVDKLNSQAHDLIERGNLDRAGEILQITESKAQSMNYTEGIAQARAYQGMLYLHRGYYNKAIELLREIFIKYEDTDAGLTIGNLLGNAYQYNGNSKEALRIYHELLERAKREEDLKFEAALEQNVAAVYDLLGDYSSALKHYFNSLEIADSRADTSVKIVAYSNIGTLYHVLENYDNAERYLLESLELSRITNSPSDISRALNNLGILKRSLGKYDEAVDHYNESLQIAEKLGNITSPIRILFNMGNIYLDLEEYEKAEEAFQESMIQSREINLIQGEYYNNIGLGDVRKAFGEYDDAIVHFREALKIAKELSSTEMESAVLERLWMTYEDAGDYREAFTYLNLHKDFSDSLQSAEHDEAIARYETMFDLRSEREQNRLLEEKLDAQQKANSAVGISFLVIALAAFFFFFFYRKKKEHVYHLKIQNEELERLHEQVDNQKEELSQLNHTKDKLFSILAHDLRSPVSKLQSLVMLIQEDDLEEVEMSDLISQLDLQLQYSIRTLENYLSWAQSQMKGLKPVFRPVNLHVNVEEVTDMLNQLADQKQIHINNRIDEDLYVIADQNMILVILQNLISNALKFSHPDSLVTVDAEKEAGRIILSVRDKGVGITEEKQGEIFQAFNKSRQGTKNEKGTGLGLSICREFAEQLRGKIWYESTFGEGTTFYVALEDAENISAGTGFKNVTSIQEN